MNYKKAAAEAVVSALGSDQITIEQAERLMAVPPNPEMGTSRSPVSPLQNNFASLLSQSLQNFRKNYRTLPNPTAFLYKQKLLGDI